jgi:hypothetical protein
MEPLDRGSQTLDLLRNLATETVGDPQTFALAALFSFQGANTKS